MKGVQMVKVTRVWTGEDWSPQHIDLSIIQLGPVNTITTGPTVTAKLTGPWSAADKTHVGPLNLLYRMHVWNKQNQAKFILGVVIWQKFSYWLVL